MKLEKDKLNKKAMEMQRKIKEHEEKVSKDIEDVHKRQSMGNKNKSKSPQKGKFIPYPEDARPNPYLAKTYEDLPQRPNFLRKIDAH